MAGLLKMSANLTCHVWVLLKTHIRRCLKIGDPPVLTVDKKKSPFKIALEWEYNYSNNPLLRHTIYLIFAVSISPKISHCCWLKSQFVLVNPMFFSWNSHLSLGNPHESFITEAHSFGHFGPGRRSWSSAEGTPRPGATWHWGDVL